VTNSRQRCNAAGTFIFDEGMESDRTVTDAQAGYVRNGREPASVILPDSTTALLDASGQMRSPRLFLCDWSEAGQIRSGIGIHFGASVTSSGKQTSFADSAVGRAADRACITIDMTPGVSLSTGTNRAVVLSVAVP
jgi:hypothetical protein